MELAILLQYFWGSVHCPSTCTRARTHTHTHTHTHIQVNLNPVEGNGNILELKMSLWFVKKLRCSTGTSHVVVLEPSYWFVWSSSELCTLCAAHAAAFSTRGRSQFSVFKSKFERRSWAVQTPQASVSAKTWKPGQTAFDWHISYKQQLSGDGDGHP